MVFRLSFYNETVEAELDAWPVGLRARFRALTVRMEEYGPNLGMLHTRALGNGLFEIRARQRKELEERFSAPWSEERLLSFTVSSKRRTRHHNGKSI
jgi:hypothetical protein